MPFLLMSVLVARVFTEHNRPFHSFFLRAGNLHVDTLMPSTSLSRDDAVRVRDLRNLVVGEFVVPMREKR